MLDTYFVINNIYFLLVKDTLLGMTVNNPIFIFAVITVIWFIPGILVRRFNEQRMVKKKERNQSEAIKKLYPKAKDFPD
tara:strand:- start:780 stop:1016 length:237 start_codon:yes stop_codon:yes gene_type:complete